MTELFNKKETKNTRRILRMQNVSAEKILWQKLRKRQLQFRFNRQYGIGKFIVDFYCAEKKLIIEIDGATHSTEREIFHDKEREKYFKSLGLNIARYTNTDIFSNLDLVVDDIYKKLIK